MSLLHVADLHLGLRGAEESTARSWLRACELAVEHEAEAIIVAGDTFHGPNPDAQAIHAFLEGVKHASGHMVPVVAIAGNHDRAAFPSQPAILDALDDGRSPEFRDLVGVTTPQVVELAHVSPTLRIACLPSIGRAQLAAGGSVSRAELEQQVVDALRRILDGLRAEGADVLTLHYTIAGSALGSEADVSLIDEPMLAPADLDGPWGWIAAGHIHKAQMLATPTPPGFLPIGAYAGSIDRMNFGEEGQRKGAWLVGYEDEHGGRFHEFLELPSRQFVTIDLTADTPMEALSASQIQGAIVRVRGSAAQAREAEEARALMLRLEVASCRIDLERPERAPVRGEEVRTASSPIDALRAWLERTDLPEAQQGRVLDLAGGLT